MMEKKPTGRGASDTALKAEPLSTSAPAPAATDENDRPLLKNNFIMMIIAGVLIVAGFVLMTGSSSGTDAYNPDIFSTRRIVVGPMISFIGFVFMAIAIIVKPKSK